MKRNTAQIQSLLQTIRKSWLLQNLPEVEILAIVAEYEDATPEQIDTVIAEIRKRDEKMKRQTKLAEQAVESSDMKLKNAVAEYKQFNKRVIKNNEIKSAKDDENACDHLLQQIKNT